VWGCCGIAEINTDGAATLILPSTCENKCGKTKMTNRYRENIRENIRESLGGSLAGLTASPERVLVWISPEDVCAVAASAEAQHEIRQVMQGLLGAEDGNASYASLLATALFSRFYAKASKKCAGLPGDLAHHRLMRIPLEVFLLLRALGYCSVTLPDGSVREATDADGIPVCAKNTKDTVMNALHPLVNNIMTRAGARTPPPVGSVDSRRKDVLTRMLGISQKPEVSSSKVAQSREALKAKELEHANLASILEAATEAKQKAMEGQDFTDIANAVVNRSCYAILDPKKRETCDLKSRDAHKEAVGHILHPQISDQQKKVGELKRVADVERTRLKQLEAAQLDQQIAAAWKAHLDKEHKAADALRTLSRAQKTLREAEAKAKEADAAVAAMKARVDLAEVPARNLETLASDLKEQTTRLITQRTALRHEGDVTKAWGKRPDPTWTPEAGYFKAAGDIREKELVGNRAAKKAKDDTAKQAADMATSRKVAEDMAAKAVQTFHLKAKAAAETATAEKATAEKAAAEKAAAEKAAAEKAAADKTAAAEKAAADKTAAAEKAAADKTAAWRQKAIVKARAERKKMRTAYKTAARESQALRESKLSLSHLEALALAYPDGRSNAAHREDDASSTTSWHSTEN
jgi:hypothetical protein